MMDTIENTVEKTLPSYSSKDQAFFWRKITTDTQDSDKVPMVSVEPDTSDSIDNLCSVVDNLPQGGRQSQKLRDFASDIEISVPPTNNKITRSQSNNLVTLRSLERNIYKFRPINYNRTKLGAIKKYDETHFRKNSATDIDLLIRRLERLPQELGRSYLDQLVNLAASFDKLGNYKQAKRAWDAVTSAYDRYIIDLNLGIHTGHLPRERGRLVPVYSICALLVRDYDSVEALEAAAYERIEKQNLALRALATIE